MKNGYNEKVVTAYFNDCGLPTPLYEYDFHPNRRWRFDLAWPSMKLAVEVQGGIWKLGRHNRGAAMLKEWEKLNEAAAMGWRIIYCQPSELTMMGTVLTIKRAMLL